MPVRSLHSRTYEAVPPLRIVAIGGGNGLSSLLHGLKQYVFPNRARLPAAILRELPLAADFDITAVVTVTDDGGSSGRLRRDFDVLPPGDIRNCMVALSEDEALLSQLFQYRFHSGVGLKGHSFGNLFLTALTQLTGDFQHAIKVSSEILNIAGRIYPSTASNVTLVARLDNGARVSGETRISKSRSRIASISLAPRRPKPLPETLAAIAEADIITLGPGSLFTSVIPNLLVTGISEAIGRSKALKVYVCNLMWQPGETMQFRASDHVAAIHKHARRRLIDTIVVNTAPIRDELLTRYAAQKVMPVENDTARLRAMGLDVVEGTLLAQSEKVRHDPAAVAEIVVRLATGMRAGRRPPPIAASGV